MMMRLALAAVLALSVSALIAATPPALFPDRTIEVQGAPRDVRFSPDGRFVAVGTDKGVVGVWDADAGASVRSASLCACPLARLAFNAQANLVAAGGQDGKVYL